MQQDISVAAMLTRIQPHLTAFGITRVANVTGLDCLDVPVAMVCRPNSRSLAVFQGKGLDYDMARLSGLMEAIESFHTEMVSCPSLSASFNSLQRGVCLGLERMPRLKDRHFDASAARFWIMGHDLISGAEKLVPYQCIHMDCTITNGAEEQVFISDTSGLAAGGVMIDAVNHGLCEVIERDAMAMWSFTAPKAKSLRKIKLDTIDDLFIRGFLERCEAANVGVGIWDITSDIGIPTFICKIMTRDFVGNGIRPAFGSGTHPSRLKALHRAVTEAAQSRITFIAGARDDQYTKNYSSQLSMDAYKRWHSDIVEQPPTMSFDDMADFVTQDAQESQRILLQGLEAQGLNEVVSVALTKDDFGIPVAKVFVPGLEGITFSGSRVVGERGRHYLASQGGHA